MHAAATTYAASPTLSAWAGDLTLLEQVSQSQTARVAPHITPYASHLAQAYGLEHFHSGLSNTFDLRPVNHKLVMTLSRAATAAAAAALVPATGLAAPGMWVQTYDAPHTTVTWDSLQHRLQQHPAMTSPQVQSFIRAAPLADVTAIRDIYDLTEEFFGDVVGLQREYSFHNDHDTGEPVLFLTLRTHGQLDVDELLEREVGLLTAADTQPALKATQAYHVVTAV